jgi:hypothetical protein
MPDLRAVPRLDMEEVYRVNLLSKRPCALELLVNNTCSSLKYIIDPLMDSIMAVTLADPTVLAAAKYTLYPDLNNEEVNIQLQAQQRGGEHGEPIVLVLSATSYVTNTEPLTVQLIVESSTGVSITESTAEQGSGSQFSTVTTVDPGSSESLRLILDPNEAGTYQITTEIVYYVGEDQTSGSGERTSISVAQKPEPRSLLWWSPVIIGFIIGGSIAL